MRAIFALSMYSVIILPACGYLDSPANAQSLNYVGKFDAGSGEGTEIISVQAGTARAALTNSITGTITILDLSDPAAPAPLNEFDLRLSEGESITSAAFHPHDDYFIANIKIDGAATGRAEVRNATTGAVLNVLATGSEPDAVVIDHRGRRAVISNEGESFSFNATTLEFDSPDGSVTIIDLRNGPAEATAILVALPDAVGTPGIVTGSDGRFIEREVDLNGNGKIDSPFDFNNDGDFDDDVVVGFVDGVPVEASEEDGEVLLIPITSAAPKFLEPEIGAFSKDGRLIFVALQENNAIAVIDAVDGMFLRYVGLGMTIHPADKTEDGFIDFSETLIAFREPDGVALTPDGRFLVTADEGDTDPKASKTPDGYPTAGGRTVSVFDARTGVFIGDTGNQLDEAAAAAGLYPDDRSDSKGSEPENLATFRYRGVPYAAVGLERADAVALVSLKDPRNPTVVSVVAVNAGTELSSQAPEGIAVFDADGDSVFVYSANEGSGVVSAFEVTPF